MPEKLKNIPAELLVPAFVLLRLVDKTSLDYIEMRDSIAAHGFFSAICVRPSKRQPDKYEIIEGLHRYCCALDCGLKEIPCVIKEATDAEVKNWQVQANLIRKTTLNSEYAARLKMMFIENPELTMAQLAVELHCRPAKIQEILRLNHLIPAAKKHLDVGELPITAAYSLAKLPRQLQDDLLEKALILNVREFIQLCNGYRKSYKEAVHDGQLQHYLEIAANPKPYLRNFNAIRQEYEHPINGEILTDRIKLTKIEIWKLALAWVLHIDPESLREGQRRAKERADKEQAKLEKRLMDRNRVHRSRARKLGVDPEDNDMIEVVT
jgi:ParB/RepB/Spo0J family partition protein